MHLLFSPGRQLGFKHASTIILEFCLNRLGIDRGWILRGDRGRPDNECKRRDNCRNNESPFHEKGFLERQLQALFQTAKLKCRESKIRVANNYAPARDLSRFAESTKVYLENGDVCEKTGAPR